MHTFKEYNLPIIESSLYLFQHTGDLLYVVDADGIIRRSNDNCEDILGVPKEKIIGKSVDDLWTMGIFNENSTIRLGYDDTDPTILLKTLGHQDLAQYNLEKAPRLSLYALEQKKVITGINQLPGNNNIVLFICIPVFTKENDVDFILTVVRNLSDVMILKTNLSKLSSELEYLRTASLGHTLIGTSRQMQHIQYLVNQAAQSDATVLISGETGTGKEVVAREIVKNSMRRDKPYVRINCSAIPDTLFESELFGYEKGSFTGALNTRKIGLLESANGGTVLLDEIENLSLASQAKLLRVIQEQEIMRIGSTEPIKIDVRIISTANRNLREMSDNGAFRLDLFYRLNVIPIDLPPLRDRREDILPLSAAFLSNFNLKYGRDKYLEPDAIAALECYEWPGNVRDLEHTIERLVVIGSEPEITQDDVDFAIFGQSEDFDNVHRQSKNLQTMMDEYEKQLISYTAAKCRTTREMAESLGISQPSVSRKMNKYGITCGGKGERSD